MPLSTLPIFLHQILKQKNTSWMTCGYSAGSVEAFVYCIYQPQTQAEGQIYNQSSGQPSPHWTSVTIAFTQPDDYLDD